MCISAIEVIEPYPNEILYSWLSRMFYWYGFRNNPRSNIRSFNLILFGKNTRSLNNILIPNKLAKIVENINLPNSQYFNSVDSLIHKVTFIPFYIAFLNEIDKKKILKFIVDMGPLITSKSILGLSHINSFSDEYKFKFCFKCWEENHYMYFDREHQVIENYICYKHNARLQYINSNSNEYFIFDNTCIDNYANSPYCINENSRFNDIYYMISIMIHDVFINGFKDNTVKIKSKIRMKMLSMGFMSTDFSFIQNFDEFWTSYKKLTLVNIERKDLINAIYSNKTNPNPIIYLTLIMYLFGSLKSYYKYKIDEQDIQLININPSKEMALTRAPKPCGVIYYNEILQNNFIDKYSVIEKTANKHYRLKCSICGHTWIVPQYYFSKRYIYCSKCEPKKN